MKFSGYKQKFIEFWIEKHIFDIQTKTEQAEFSLFSGGSESIDDGCDVR